MPPPPKPQTGISETEEAMLRRLHKDEDASEYFAGIRLAAQGKLREALNEARKPANEQRVYDQKGNIIKLTPARCDGRVVELLREYDQLLTQANYVSDTLAALDQNRQKREQAGKAGLQEPPK